MFNYNQVIHPDVCVCAQLEYAVSVLTKMETLHEHL